MATRDSSSRQSRSPQSNDPTRAISVLNPVVPMPEFSFFQIVKVKTTKEVGTIVGIWCIQTGEQSYQWFYRLEGLTKKSSIWWQELQLRSLDRRQNR
ncbi:MAG: hypothetical protein B0A82_11495 [Alkalinema sp. CACIAM 70d]|nr:MAG: hypothetical protein B0A82_11495 [Alkalinema sp. CACIAM 70d]